jgi:FkbM family methyltransferase
VVLLASLRPLVDRFLPAWATVYRDVRDRRAFARQAPAPTAYGVKLMGHAGMEAGMFEREETELARRLLEDADVFVDVGANIGLYTCLARAARRTVIAVEPLQRNLDYLYANLRANGFDDVEVFPVGLAQAPGLATLFGGSTGASLIRGWADAPAPLARTIPLSTLDTLLGDRFSGRRLLIKIDVEGAELGVLRGAARTLARVPAPVWLVEISRGELHPDRVNADRRAAFQVFDDAGYAASAIEDPERILPIGAQGPALAADGGSNYLFRHLVTQTSKGTLHGR